MKIHSLIVILFLALILPAAGAEPLKLNCKGFVTVDGLPYTGPGWIRLMTGETGHDQINPAFETKTEVLDGLYAVSFEIDNPVIFTETVHNVWFSEDPECGFQRIGSDLSPANLPSSKESAANSDSPEIAVVLPPLHKQATPRTAGFSSDSNKAASQSAQDVVRLLVASRKTDSVLNYDGTDGASLGAFVTSQAGGLSAPYGLAFGPDGNLYVASNATHSVLRFDGRTGEFVDVFVEPESGEIENPWDLAFGPDGNLYVTSPPMAGVFRYNGTTGAFINVFASHEDLTYPTGLAFGPNDDLYVANHVADNVLRFDGETGELIGTFVTEKSGGLDGPIGLLFGPDDNLYVASAYGDSVLRYNGVNGQSIDTFVSAGSGGLDSPSLGLAFGPDENLYVSSSSTNSIVRYDGQTGSWIDAFISSGVGGLDAPRDLLFSYRLNVTASARIEPATPNTEDDLQCTTTLENHGGYSNLAWFYQWFRNGEALTDGMVVNEQFLSPTASILSHHFTTKNETYFCAARVTNGILHFDALTEAVTIANSPPSAPTIAIRPEQPTPDDGLAMWIDVESTDPDGDGVVYLIEWFESPDGQTWTRRPELSGNPPPLYDQGEPEISHLYTQMAEFWRLTITPIEVWDSPKPLALMANPGVRLQGDPVFGESDSYDVYILPDLTGDDRVDAEDVLLLKSVWHQQKKDMDAELRPLFFESADAPTEQVGLDNLIGLTQKDWQKTEGD